MITADRAEGGEIKQSLALEPSEDKTTGMEMLLSYLISSHFIQHVIKPEGRTLDLVFFIFPDNRGFLFL